VAKRERTDRVALVTGASRGVGKGVAIGLGESGTTVYVTGRSEQEALGRPGTIHATARAVDAAGGQGVAVRCDHTSEEDVRRLFGQIERDHGRLDILVNNAWGGYENMVENGVYTYDDPFWEQPLWRWDAMFTSGVRCAYLASQCAAPLMVQQKAGLIVNISYWAAQTYLNNVAYGAAKTATDRLSRDMAHELRRHSVAVVSLYPGLVRTESVMAAAGFFNLANSESPQFIGRVIGALASDTHLLRKSGQALVAATVARELDVTDIDGTQPTPLALDTLGSVYAS
jgi:dehydrogenase/reductase SDR family protein 1